MDHVYVDLPIQNGDFYGVVSLPEGKQEFKPAKEHTRGQALLCLPLDQYHSWLRQGPTSTSGRASPERLPRNSRERVFENCENIFEHIGTSGQHHTTLQFERM